MAAVPGMAALTAFLLMASSVCVAEIPEHRIGKIPGFKGSFSTRQWSGYIPVSMDSPEAYQVNVHYWLFESKKGLDQSPIVAWYQGGPGGSSLLALLTENGPLTLNDRSFQSPEFNETGVPSVFENQYSWHSEANMLYVEHPAPTGFSYCEPTCPKWNDTLQAVINYKFLVNFFKAYRELEKNEFYLTGESYAGVLVPTVVLNIYKATNDSNRKIAPWSLKGFALGNACPGNRVFTCTPYSGWKGVQVAVDFRYGHGMISPETYKEINEACKSDWDRFEPPLNETCQKILGPDPARPVMQEAGDTYTMGGGYYLYDHCGTDLINLSPDDGLPRESKDMQPPDLWERGTLPVYECGQERASKYWLNLEAVQNAIHVKPQEFSFITPLDYNFTKFSLLEEYKDILAPTYNIYQYSGDADPCVPHVGTRRWIESLNFKVKEPWHPWIVNQQIAGYRTTYIVNDEKTFDFVSIRNAGHMVPRYKPAVALALFQSFLGGK